jgi:hypothetical protein
MGTAQDILRAGWGIAKLGIGKKSITDVTNCRKPIPCPLCPQAQVNIELATAEPIKNSRCRNFARFALQTLKQQPISCSIKRSA